MFRLTAPILLLSLASTASAVDPELLRMAPPEANFFLGARLAAVSDSPLTRMLLDEGRKSSPEFVALFERAEASNPLDGLDEILMLGRVEAGAAERGPADGLILVRGDFSTDRWIDAVCETGCEEDEYGGLRLLRTEYDGKPAAMVVFDRSLAAAGSPAEVRALIDRRAGRSPAGLAPSAREWIAKLGDHHAWLAATGPFEKPPTEAAAPVPGLDLVEKLEGFGLGVTLDEEFRLAIEMLAADAGAAAQMHQMLGGLLAMATMSRNRRGDGPSPAATFARRVALEMNGRVVAAAFRMPADEFTASLREGIRNRREAAGRGESPETASAEPPPPAPARRGVIIIHGLEAEPIEVPAGDDP